MNTLRGITYGQSMFVAVGVFGEILTSTNATNWTSASSPGDFYRAVVYGNDRFVAVGGARFFGDFPTAAIATSTNGLDWTNVSIGGPELYGIGFSHCTFVAGGLRCGFPCFESELISSNDGAHWRSRDSGTFTDLYGVAYGNSAFIVVGQYGTILQSDPFAAHLELVTRSSDGRFLFNLVGEVGQRYQVDASADLANWTVFTNFVGTAETNLLTDTTARDLRFYRAVAQ